MPDTPPRYRYVKGASDSEESEGAEDPREARRGVLAAKTKNRYDRNSSIHLSRRMDRQRRGCPESTASGVACHGGLPAPPLLQLGQWIPPVLPDPLPTNGRPFAAGMIGAAPGLVNLSAAGPMPSMPSVPSVSSVPGAAGIFSPLQNPGMAGFPGPGAAPAPPFPGHVPGPPQRPLHAQAGAQHPGACQRSLSAGHGPLREPACGPPPASGFASVQMPAAVMMVPTPQQQQQQQQQVHCQARTPTPGPLASLSPARTRQGSLTVSHGGASTAAAAATASMAASVGRRCRSSAGSSEAGRSASPARGQQHSMRRACTPVKVQHLTPPRGPQSPAPFCVEGAYAAEPRGGGRPGSATGRASAAPPGAGHGSSLPAALCPSWGASGTSLGSTTRNTASVATESKGLSFGSIDTCDTDTRAAERVLSPLLRGGRAADAAAARAAAPLHAQALLQIHTPPSTPGASSSHARLTALPSERHAWHSEPLASAGSSLTGIAAAPQLAAELDAVAASASVFTSPAVETPLRECSGGSAPSKAMAPLRNLGSVGVPPPGAKRRVLVTGATGLLGRQLMHALDAGTWEIRGLCRKRPQPPRVVACDLTIEGAPEAQIEDFRPHAVIHLAAEWRPEVLRRSPARARLLNVDVTAALAAACERSGAWLLYVSADCVFDGRTPPYTTDAMPNPLSEYGWQKLHGEQLTLAACPQAAVLRVPLLYGPLESITDSAVSSLYQDLRGGVREVDAWQTCYPTFTCDVARVIAAMLRFQQSGERVRGIFHWQGNESFTWHEMMLIVADICGIDASGVAPVRSTPKVPLPRDTRLDCSRLELLVDAALPRTRFREGLRMCLAPLCSPAGSPAPAFRAATSLAAPERRAGIIACDRSPDDSERQFREELKARGAALQELFWQELERTRNRLREAGLVGAGRLEPQFTPSASVRDKRLLASLLQERISPPDDLLGRALDSGTGVGSLEAWGSGTPKRASKHRAPGTLYFPPEQQV